MNAIAVRIALASLAVAATAVAIVSLGVFRFGAETFHRLMLEHGATAELSREMFDESIRFFFLVATAGAAIGSVALAVLLARWLTAPLARIADVATRIARGERNVRAPDGGPREVASLAASFNRMAERIEEQERLRGEFVANAAHELRTPLTNLVGYLEALRDGVIAPTQDTFASLREETERLARLARSLDALAIGDRETETPLTELDLRAAIETAVELALPQFERQRIAVSVEVPAGVRVRANPDHLAQVLANLLQNAMRYTPEAGRVAVSAEPSGDGVTVAVANTGEEIPRADLPHVFERFYRVEKSRDRARGGAGIGLAIVKQLVELGGGSVGVESGGGLTRFWFRIPA